MLWPDIPGAPVSHEGELLPDLLMIYCAFGYKPALDMLACIVRGTDHCDIAAQSAGVASHVAGAVAASRR
jgi:hypothetical protein